MTENLGLGNRDYGFFSCEPTIKLLLDGRNVQIMEGATYTDPDGKVWEIYPGDLSDGATVPKELWSLVGGPFEGPYRVAALFHDRQCNYYLSIAERKAADRMFRVASLCAGCTIEQADALYAGVSIGTLEAEQEGRVHGPKVGVAVVSDDPRGWH